jgi:3-hydroxybutyryl-CoA dehydratase
MPKIPVADADAYIALQVVMLRSAGRRSCLGPRESSKFRAGGSLMFTSSHLFFDDIEVGQEWESAGRTVTNADIVNFAGVSGDFNPIHMDHEFAKTTPFRAPIAHGMLVWSMATGLGVYAPQMRTLAFMSVKELNFREPVFIGDTIRVWCKVLAKEERSRGRRGVVTWERKILNQKGKIVQEAITVTLVEGRASIEAKQAREEAKLSREAAKG